MNIFKSLFTVLFLVAVFICPNFAFAQDDDYSAERTLLLDTDLIDVPTAGTLDYYGLGLKTRFFSQGGVLAHLTFGVLPRLNLGASVTIERLVGDAEPVRLVRPEIQVKFRFYDGTTILPMLAIGYDGQGYYYNPDSKRFSQERRGLYLVGSKEIIIPNLYLHPGVSFADFDSEDIYGFVSANFVIQDAVALMAEWDHIQSLDDSRVNLGLRFYITPFFHCDFAVRSVGKDDEFEDGTRHRSERVAIIRYHTTF